MLACFVNIVGIVVSLVAVVRSRRAGDRNPAGVAGIVIGGVSILATALAFILLAQVAGGSIGLCADSSAPGYELACNG